jgi:hypothetical protein
MMQTSRSVRLALPLAIAACGVAFAIQGRLLQPTRRGFEIVAASIAGAEPTRPVSLAELANVAGDLTARIADPALPIESRIAAADLARMVLEQADGPLDAVRALEVEVEAMVADAAVIAPATSPLAIAAWLDLARLRRALESARGVDDDDGVTALGLERDPDNGIWHLAAAERAARRGRMAEAADSLALAARSATIDGRWRERADLVGAELAIHEREPLRRVEFLLLHEGAFLARSIVDSLSSLAGSLAEHVGRNAFATQQGHPVDVDCFATHVALHDVAGSLLATAHRVDEARDALAVPAAFLDQVAQLAPAAVPRDRGERRRFIEQRLAANGENMRRRYAADEAAATRFHAAVARSEPRSEAVLERTQRALDVARAQAILLPWTLVALIAGLVFALLAGRFARAASPPPGRAFLIASAVLRVAALVTPWMALFLAALTGSWPLDRGRGFERILVGFATPWPPLLLLPIAALPILLLLALHRSGRDPRRLCGQFARAAVAAAFLLFAAFGITSWPVERELSRRATALDSLRVESYEAALESGGRGGAPRD